MTEHTQETNGTNSVSDLTLDEALALMHPNTTLTRWTDTQWRCQSHTPGKPYPTYLTRYADTPALAVSRWRLAYEEALAAQGGAG